MTSVNPARSMTMESGVGRITFEVVTDPRQLPEFEDHWRRLADQFPDAALYDDYREEVVLQTDSDRMRLVVIRDDGEIIGFAPFILRRGVKNYVIGKRRLFSLRAHCDSLMGYDYLGNMEAATCAAVLHWLVTSDDCHLIELRDIATAGRVYQSLLNSDAKRIVWRNRSRKQAIHWVIDLPSSMEEFYGQLNKKARQNRRREFRKVFDTKGGSVVVVTSVDQVDWFLTVGERISRTTYQWRLGQQLVNDPAAQRRYRYAAEQGRLRCYVLLLDGVPCAFIRGTLAQKTYRYESPGYDPKFSADSVGTVLMLYAIEDLITKTPCNLFDFGEGGDDTGYKSQFGNRSYPSLTVDVVARRRIYSRILLALQDGLNGLKNLAGALIPQNDLTTVLRRWLRKPTALAGTQPRSKPVDE